MAQPSKPTLAFAPKRGLTGRKVTGLCHSITIACVFCRQLYTCIYWSYDSRFCQKTPPSGPPPPTQKPSARLGVAVYQRCSGGVCQLFDLLGGCTPAASTGCRQYAGGGSGARTRTSATLQTSLRFLQIIERKRGHRAGHRGRCPTARARTHDIDNRDSTPDIGRIHSTSGVFSAR